MIRDHLVHLDSPVNQDLKDLLEEVLLAHKGCKGLREIKGLQDHKDQLVRKVHLVLKVSQDSEELKEGLVLMEHQDRWDLQDNQDPLDNKDNQDF